MPNTNSSSPDVVDTLRGDHLTDRKDMILTCVHGKTIANSFVKRIKAAVIEKLMRKGKRDQNLFYYDSKKKRDSNIFRIVLKNDSHCTVISNINTQNKYSNRYYNCTGIVVIGKDKETGENISFLTHQDPLYFLVEGQREKFTVATQEVLLDLKERSVSGSIDAIILGGRNDSSYKDSIMLLDKLIFDSLNFHPVVVGGPSQYSYYGSQSKDIFVDTKNRRVHLIKPNEFTEYNINYVANNVISALNGIKQ